MEYVFTLSSIQGIGVVYYKRLVSRFGTARKVFEASFQELKEIVPEKIATQIKSVNLELSLKTASAFIEKGIKCIDFTFKEYPETFKIKEIFPPVIFYKGKLPSPEERKIALVGTRKPTNYGIWVTRKLCKELTENKFHIVSGGARGIDTEAHKTALNNGGETTAILGCGIDVVYPPENRPLFEKIVQKGCLISEFFPGTKPLKENFPRRNRLIAGLADCILVVEAGEKSGALITVRWALELGKEVYAVPGPINSPASTGTNKLIKEGAKPITCVEDILEDFGMENPKKVKQDFSEPLTELEKLVFEKISHEPKHFDELVSLTGLIVPDLLSILFQLEIKGLISELPGKFYTRNN
uniref:DNA-protecting protein DprA n=1 Tax=candidate division WOR-3 bacterium TaxID=2052148 RepID=A0A7C2P043_UNCW3